MTRNYKGDECSLLNVKRERIKVEGGGGIDEEQKHKKMEAERRNFLCVCVHVRSG